MARKSVHLLVKAVPGTRPHKYVKRIAKPGGGFRYIYAAEAGKEPGRTRREAASEEQTMEARQLRSEISRAFSEASPQANQIRALTRLSLKAHAAGNKAKADSKLREARKLFTGLLLESLEKVNVAQDKGKIREEHLRPLHRYVHVMQRPLWSEIVNADIKMFGATATGKKWATSMPEATKKSFTEENINDELSLAEREGARIAIEVRGGEEALAEKLVKAAGARGGKYLKRVPKPGGGYRYIYHSEKHRVAHQADRMEAKAKKMKARAKSLAENDMLASAGKLNAKADMLMSAARRSRKGTGFEGKSGKGDKTQMTQKSIEALAVEAAMSHSPSNLVKAVLEVPAHAKTRKKTIPDERLLAIFKAYVRTEYRNASRYGDGTNAQSVYDRVLSNAEYNHYAEAALGVLEKRKTPFSVDYVKQRAQEVDDAQKEAGQVAPEPTAPSSIAASGG